jgi:hypothetical protein
MFYFDLYIINVYVILPPDLGPFAVNKYIHEIRITSEKSVLKKLNIYSVNEGLASYVTK